MEPSAGTSASAARARGDFGFEPVADRQQLAAS